MHKRMLLAQKHTNCHKCPYTGLSSCPQDINSLFSEGKIKINQE